MKKIIGLIDCNNFFVSCEKVFRPDLDGVPVVVLSSNDGCVISRSYEAKSLGIPMGIPRFKIENEIRKYGIQIFSCNFALYGDLSNRIMRTLQDFAPCIEQYSIDEAFFDVTSLKNIDDYEKFGREIKQHIMKNIGVPISVAFGPNKTIAKLGNYAAKKYPATRGVVNLLNRERQIKLEKLSPLSDVWGVGKQYQEKLKSLRIETAYDLANYSQDQIRKKFGVNLERTHIELNGELCFDMNENPPLRKQIMHSSTLGEATNIFVNIKEAINNHMAKAAESMRQNGQSAGMVTVFFRSNNFVPENEYYSASLSQKFIYPTSDTRVLIQACDTLMRQIWKPGIYYSKVGIILSDLNDGTPYQLDMFTPKESDPKSQKLMNLLDHLNSENEQIFFLGQGIKRNWKPQKNYKSPNYTTRWNEIMKVK